MRRRRNGVFSGASLQSEFAKATLHALGRDPLRLVLTNEDTMIGVHMPELGPWDLVELQ